VAFGVTSYVIKSKVTRPVEACASASPGLKPIDCTTHVELSVECFWTRVRFPPAPPITTRKDTLFASRRTPSGPEPGGFLQFGLQTSLPPAHIRLSSFPLLAPSHSRPPPFGHPNGKSATAIISRSDLTHVGNRGYFFEYLATSQKQRRKQSRQVCATGCVLSTRASATTSATRRYLGPLGGLPSFNFTQPSDQGHPQRWPFNALEIPCGASAQHRLL